MQSEGTTTIAILASFICGAPVALMVLIDEGWQWFKAGGLETAQAPLDPLFCDHTQPDGLLLIVHDECCDERLAFGYYFCDA